jgi:hypothetical protein
MPVYSDRNQDAAKDVVKKQKDGKMAVLRKSCVDFIKSIRR